MRRTMARQGARQWWMVLAVLFVAVAEALAQEQASLNKIEARPGQPSRRIVISIADRKLALMEDGEVMKIYPIAVGASQTPSPRGEFRVANRIELPTYYGTGKVIEPGPANPLGTRWLGLSLKGYGIHGTNEPRSIGKRASHGCIRMRNADVEELFEIARVGDVVELHGARTAEIAHIFAPPQVPAATPAPAAPVVVAAVVGR